MDFRYNSARIHNGIYGIFFTNTNAKLNENESDLISKEVEHLSDKKGLMKVFII